MGADDIGASHRMRAKHPGAALYALRIGSDAFGQIGLQAIYDLKNGEETSSMLLTQLTAEEVGRHGQEMYD